MKFQLIALKRGNINEVKSHYTQHTYNYRCRINGIFQYNTNTAWNDYFMMKYVNFRFHLATSKKGPKHQMLNAIAITTNDSDNVHTHTHTPHF